MVMGSKARVIDLRQTVGTYDLSVLPRALFATDYIPMPPQMGI